LGNPLDAYGKGCHKTVPRIEPPNRREAVAFFVMALSCAGIPLGSSAVFSAKSLAKHSFWGVVKRV
jgi:uncharacterized protein with von Willebrand factor type A (vWA) domain